jgi:hypothetical protein
MMRSDMSTTPDAAARAATTVRRKFWTPPRVVTGRIDSTELFKSFHVCEDCKTADGDLTGGASS